MPLFIVHDLGLLLALPGDQLDLGPRVDAAKLESLGPLDRSLLRSYQALVAELGASDVMGGQRRIPLDDDTIVVVLAKLLGTVAARCPAPGYASELAYEALLREGLEPALPELFAAARRTSELKALSELVAARLYLLTVVDSLDVETLSLVSLVQEGNQGSLGHVDLLLALEKPEANDVASFSLEILPSILETKRATRASTEAGEGYAGLSRRGGLDSLVLSELAWDNEELARRVANDEALYYAHERSRSEKKRLHHLLIDASASMRGDRATFARGTAIAAAKKLLLARDDVSFCFFDSRLYEARACTGAGLPLGYLLSFEGERGRNPARVFGELARRLESAKRHDPRTPVVHCFTQAGLYVPRDDVAMVARLAPLAMVFMLPSDESPNLDYLDLLDAYWFVDHRDLAVRAARKRQAEQILERLGERSDRVAPPSPTGAVR
jgi:hypothetical protein